MPATILVSLTFAAATRARASARHLAAVAAMGAAGVAGAGAPPAATYTSVESFKQFARADLEFASFDAPSGFATAEIPANTSGLYPFVVSSTGSPVFALRPIGAARTTTDQGTVLTFGPRPITAFAVTLRVTDYYAPLNLIPIAGTVGVQTDSGLAFLVNVGTDAGGTFFGFTSPTPFSSVIIADPAGTTFEFFDDVYAGTAVSAATPGDSCVDAPSITPGLTPFSTTSPQSITTPITNPANCSASGNSVDTGPDVWFRFTAPATGNVTIATCGASFDTILRVFDRCPAVGSPQGTPITQIACNDDFCAGGGGANQWGSQVSFRLKAGREVLIRVSGFLGAAGTGNLSVAQVADCPADVNGDGQNIDDIFIFLNLWFAGC